MPTLAGDDLVAINQTNKLIEHLCRSVEADGTARTDSELLDNFLRQKDDAALTSLVRRHGRMVWGVCSRMLRNLHDAEDAFQATFLVFVQKATALPDKNMVGNWLYGVAHQTAVRMRALAAKRSVREKQLAVIPEPTSAKQYVWNDLQPILDEELSRLPEKYRALIVLCDLEGNTRTQVARQLGIPEGTVASRQATARTMLAKRLSRRGVVVSGVLLGSVLSSQVGSACIPTAIIPSVITTVTLAVGGQAATGAMSPTIQQLTNGVLKAMLMTKIKTGVAVVMSGILLVGTASLGVGVFTAPAAVAQLSGEPPQSGARQDETKKVGNGSDPQVNDPKAPKTATEEDPDRTALKARQSALQNKLDRLVAMYKRGAVGVRDVWEAELALQRLNLSLCGTTKERVEVLEKIVGIRKQVEDLTAQHFKQGITREDELLSVRADRLEAEAALKREKAKLGDGKMAATPTTKGELAVIEQKLVGAWIGEGPCVGKSVFQTDGTYHRFGYGPVAGLFESGTWKIEWSELPPTLVLSPFPTEATEAGDPKEDRYYLIKLNDKRLDVRWSKHADARIEEHRRGSDTDNVNVRIGILSSAVQRYLGNKDHGAGVNLPPSLQALVETKVLPSAKSLLDPWGKEFQYDVTGRRTQKKQVPDIWTEAPDKTVIGNWSKDR